MVALVGVGVAVLSVVAVSWAQTNFGGGVSYFELSSRATSSSASGGEEFAQLYFAILGVLLLAASAILAPLATWPRSVGRRPLLRLFAAVVLAAAVGATVAAAGALSEHVDLGAGWIVASLGYGVALVGVLIGPSRQQST